MSLSLMQVFQQFIMPAAMERLSQQLGKFNAASGGALVMTTEGFAGDFLQRSLWSSLAGAQRRVDRYKTNSPVTPTELQQIKESAVKVAGGFGPVIFEPSQMTYIQKATTEGIDLAAVAFSDAVLSDMLNTAIAALVAAIGNNPNTVNDVSGSAGISRVAFNDAHAKFGDASGNLVAQIMNGVAAHKLIGQNLTNSNQLFTAGNVTVLDVLGKPIVVTDAPALYTAGSPNKLRVLSLASSAAVVMNDGDVVQNVQTTNGKERIETTWQADYTFGLALKGYTWDEVNGGKSPTDAELATGTNWDQTAVSIKNTAGVMTIGNAAL
ncbi:major capsid protein [Massilia sp. METH4]|uniref:major capsid protein n=1 Tax=Massilia sp. METH4 TaxID=3123041 RepID=UPI0030CC6F17